MMGQTQPADRRGARDLDRRQEAADGSGLDARPSSSSTAKKMFIIDHDDKTYTEVDLPVDLDVADAPRDGASR